MAGETLWLDAGLACVTVTMGRMVFKLPDVMTKSILNVLKIVLDIGVKNNSRKTISFIVSRTNQIINVTNSSFLNFLSENEGAITNFDTFLLLQSNLFYKNKAQKGGALYTSNSNVTINDNYFLSNIAKMEGPFILKIMKI